MRRGAVGVQLESGTSISGPSSGVHIGVGPAGPVSLRLFRLTGTSVSVAAPMLPAQLIAVRAAAAGTPVQVVTTRPHFWEPLLPLGRSRSYVVAQSEQPQPAGGPSLVIEDRPGQARRAVETAPWQCRIEVRTEWSAADLASFVYADLAVFGAVPPTLSRPVAVSFRLPAEQVEGLSGLEFGRVAIARRGRLEVVALDPAPAERALLDAAQSASASPAGPIWR